MTVFVNDSLVRDSEYSFEEIRDVQGKTSSSQEEKEGETVLRLSA